MAGGIPTLAPSGLYASHGSGGMGWALEGGQAPVPGSLPTTAMAFNILNAATAMACKTAQRGKLEGNG